MPGGIKQLIHQIDQEADAMYRGLYGTAMTGRHDFINARYRAIDEHQSQLESLIGETAASLTDTLIESRRVLVELEYKTWGSSSAH